MSDSTFTAFADDRRVAHGSLADLLRDVKTHLDHGGPGVLIFEDDTGREVDYDFRGTLQDVLDRALPRPAPRAPGRPKLGVTAREVTLLPRHWEWLDAQPGGASGTLRRLVDDARRRDDAPGRARRAADATARFLTATCGDRPHYEDALRALYAADRDRFAALTASWPADLRDHALRLAEPAFTPSGTTP